MNPVATDDPFHTLGLPPGADEDAIRCAYRRLAKENHPDVWIDAPPMIQRFVARKMAKVNAALNQIKAASKAEDRRGSAPGVAEADAARREMHARWERAEQRAQLLESFYAPA